MGANGANKKRVKHPGASSRRSHGANGANKATVIRDATEHEIGIVRNCLIWFRDHEFTFEQMAADLGKSNGWFHRVINDYDRYRVTSVDVAVITASHRSALRLYQRNRQKYKLMQAIITKAGAIMNDVQALAEEA